jgi:hypothetical protein
MILAGCEAHGAKYFSIAILIQTSIQVSYTLAIKYNPFANGPTTLSPHSEYGESRSSLEQILDFREVCLNRRSRRSFGRGLDLQYHLDSRLRDELAYGFVLTNFSLPLKIFIKASRTTCSSPGEDPCFPLLLWRLVVCSQKRKPWKGSMYSLAG